ncbi:MAG TPA: HAMP domain-containing sensor histidine kinase [Candidatus Acidoferrum sp.]|jgi:signal transduction histidine kinase|nr:HAMP domain-containing sensor histidine kinase [Candidatus Acidoferrum sp.]
MKLSIVSRLSLLYAVLLGITVMVVIVASSIALVLDLYSFNRDIVLAKHEEARTLVDQYRADGMSLKTAAPQIASALSGIGLSVAVFDERGKFLGGDRTVHPRLLGRLVASRLRGAKAGGTPNRFGTGLLFGPPPGAPGSPPPRGGAALLLRANETGTLPPPEPSYIAPVDGGFVAFQPSVALLWVSLIPYWRVVIVVAIVAMLLSWLVGRLFANQALRPINDLTESLKALARGDFTQRRFIAPGGDEIGTLTAAYNDAAASVAEAMNERRETEERMRQFVADAGHELRTPLTVIGGYIDVLRRGAVAEPTIARQILGTMSIEKEHMRNLIDRLMRLARLDSETPPRAEAIDLAELLRNQCDAARRLDETREIDYSVDGADNVVADRTELGEALWNVVENALKYAPDAPIHLRAIRNNGHTMITVRDEGPGMTESERLHAFERFYRGDQRGELTGSGLGLAIAKRAVERAGGSIGIDSAPARGTTVTIRL